MVKKKLQQLNLFVVLDLHLNKNDSYHFLVLKKGMFYKFRCIASLEFWLIDVVNTSTNKNVVING